MTAGASGIGKEIARAFVASGAKVYVRDIDETGFTEDISEGAPICRWLIDGIAVDVMPTDEEVWASAIAGIDKPCSMSLAGLFQMIWPFSW